ncbi:MAG: hypothetical protein COA80_19545 [Leeuwenhoekiella sp.]|nr:MAG: hypothetical protein COA80_19545 [Leeuwenhoekiella sp.]
MTKKQYVNEELVQAISDLLYKIGNEHGRNQGNVASDIFEHIKYNVRKGRIETTEFSMRISTLFELCSTYTISMPDFLLA